MRDCGRGWSHGAGGGVGHGMGSVLEGGRQQRPRLTTTRDTCKPCTHEGHPQWPRGRDRPASAEQGGKPRARPGVQHPGERRLVWPLRTPASRGGRDSGQGGGAARPPQAGRGQRDWGRRHGHVRAPRRDHTCHFLGSWHLPLMKHERHRVWAGEGPRAGRGRRQACRRRGQAAPLPKALASPSSARLPRPPPDPGPHASSPGQWLGDWSVTQRSKPTKTSRC